MGRLHHIIKTLPENLLAIRDVAGVEVLLLDYSSPDGLRNWVLEHMDEALKSRLLMFYSCSGQTLFRMSHAKNISHRLARGEIVCNVDADNFVGIGFAEYVIGFFSNHPGSFLRAPVDTGACGRIAIAKRDFISLGGYDERLSCGWGYEDRDFVNRAKLAGLAEHKLPTNRGFLRTLEHSSAERVAYSLHKDQWKSREIHRQLSEERIRQRGSVANEGVAWGSTIVTNHLNQTITI